MSNYHLVFVTDQNYLPYTFVACQSIINSIGHSHQIPLLPEYYPNLGQYSNYMAAGKESLESCSVLSELSSYTPSASPASFNNQVNASLVTNATTLANTESFANATSLANADSVTTSGDKLVFHLLVDNSVYAATLKSKARHFSERNAAVIANEIIVHEIDKGIFANCKPRGEQRSYGIYYRLLLDKVIAEDIDTVLYLDADVLVRQDIRKLFSLSPLEGHIAAAVLDVFVSPNHQSGNLVLEANSAQTAPSSVHLNLEHYFNSGMLLINLKEWRQQHIAERCIELIKNYKVISPDQDALNIAIEQPLLLADTWNFQVPLLFANYVKELPQEAWLKIACDNPFYQAVRGKHNDTSAYYQQEQERLAPDLFCNSSQTDSFSNSSQSDSFNTVSQYDSARTSAASKDKPIVSWGPEPVFAPAIVHFIFTKPWHLKLPKFHDRFIMPCPPALLAALQEWQKTAQQVNEYPELQQIPPITAELMLYRYHSLVAYKLAMLDQENDKNRRKRRRAYRALGVGMAVLLLMQVFTWLMIWLY